MSIRTAFFFSLHTLLLTHITLPLKRLVANRNHYWLIMIFSLLISACSSPTTQPSIRAEQNDLQTNAEKIQLVLQQIRTSSGPQRNDLQLKLASLLLDEKQNEHANDALQAISTADLSTPNFATYSALLCRIQIKRGEYDQALNTLDNPRLTEISAQLSIKKQIQLSSLRAKTLAFLGSHLASAQQRIYIDPLLDPSAQLENRKRIWRSLMYIPLDELVQYQQTAFGSEFQGWIALALIAKNSQGDLSAQVKQLDNWQLQWSDHSANQQLPEDLALIRELANNQARHIAILLPLTGNKAIYGQAIRDGFMAAHYDRLARGTSTPTIKIYDTETDTPFMTIYRQAVTDGAEVIIGPLDKDRVRLLFDEDISRPTLALNRIDDYGVSPPQVFQFGLAPADEAKQIAELAFLEKHRRALIIRPAGSWGEKVSNDFENHWEQLGGQTLYNSIFTDQADYSSSIKNALHLQYSEMRAKKIQSIIGEHIEFLPRRRNDVDMIFLLARQG